MTEAFVYTTPDGSRVTKEVSASNPLPTSAPTLLASPGKQSFTRPADTTAYAAGDLVANSTTAGSVTALSWTGATLSGSGGSGIIDGLLVGKTGSSTCSLRVHFFKSAPTVANGDNGAISVTFAAASSAWDLDQYIGSIDVSLGNAVNGGAVGEALNAGLQYNLPSGDTIYALIEALAAFTPSSGSVIDVKPKLKRFS